MPGDWLRFGAASMLRYRSFRKPSVLCHEELLLTVAREGSATAAYWAARELERAVRDEAHLRYHLWACVRLCPTVSLFRCARWGAARVPSLDLRVPLSRGAPFLAVRAAARLGCRLWARVRAYLFQC